MSETRKSLGSNPLGYVLSILGGKWKPYIIWYLSESETSLRYSELKRRIPFEISHKVFSQQLRELAEEGIVVRRSIPMEENNNMPHVSYELTEKGRSLSSVVFLLHDWGAAYGSAAGAAGSGIKASRGLVGPDKIYYPSHRCAQDGSLERSALGDVIVWFPEARRAAV